MWRAFNARLSHNVWSRTASVATLKTTYGITSRVTDTATWNEGANTVAVPGSEALIGGEQTAYGLQGRSLLLLIAK